MGKLISIRDFTFTYPDQASPALDGIQLDVQTGDFLILVGATGSGKTTLLRQLKRELVPAGTATGDVEFAGQPIDQLDHSISAQRIGFVAQNPQTQPIMATVIEELTFPLENLGYSSTEINSRVAELANFLGLDRLLQEQIKNLSGGQVQLVNLASVLALKPQMILLDEPTAQLDPTTSQNFLNVLQQIHEELGITIILSEHRLSRVLGLANRLVVLADGRLIYNGGVSQGLKKMWETSDLRAFVPAIPQFFLMHHLGDDTLPLSIPRGRQLIEQGKWHFKSQIKENQPVDQSNEILTAKDVVLHFPEKVVLQQLTLTVHQGEWLAIIGKNGSGKSTLLSVLTGLRKPQHGKVRIENKLVWKMTNQQRLHQIAYLSQNPTEQFLGKTVREELDLQNRLNEAPLDDTQLLALMARLHLTKLANQNVFDLSGGQQQLLGLGLVLVTHPQILVLDEPTKGLDPNTQQQLGNILRQVHHEGTTIVMASHDMDFCARYADHCTFMFNGQVNLPTISRKFFTQNFLFTTAVNRLLADQVPTALFSQDVRLSNHTMKGGEMV